MTRVAIVAGSPVLRAGLESLLAGATSIVVVGALAEPHAPAGVEAAGERVLDGEPDSLLELVAPLAPDVVVWVADGPIDDALVSLRTDERASLAGPAVVLLVDDASPHTVSRAVRSGVRAVLPREAGADEIVAAIDAAAAGLLSLPADVAMQLLAAPNAARASAGVPNGTVSLTAREREVLALLAQGLANKAIAPRLGISEHTVKAHVAAIFEKLDVGTRAEAVVTAARLGMLLL